MKWKFAAGLLILTLSVGLAQARGDYYPPERINCKLNQLDQVNCEYFNRDFLTEEYSNADLNQNKDDVFYFVSAVAYVSPNQSKNAVFYTYHNKMSKMVRLKTINSSLRPDFSKGNWIKFNNDIYTCDAGYMNCPINKSLA